MTNYHDEMAGYKATAESTVTALAAELDGWTADIREEGNPKLTREDGVEILAHVETYGAKAGRLTLTGWHPSTAVHSEGDYSGLDRPEITVSPDRPAATLAKDVARRLIPDAVEYWEAVSGRVARRLARANARETLARELAEIMGTAPDDFRNGWHAPTPDKLRNREGYTYGKLTPDSDASRVDVEIRNLTPAEARELAALIAKWSEVSG